MMTVTVKQLEAEIEKYGELPALLAGCRSTIHELATIGKRHYERAEQLQAANSILESQATHDETELKIQDDRIEQLQARLDLWEQYRNGELLYVPPPEEKDGCPQCGIQGDLEGHTCTPKETDGV